MPHEFNNLKWKYLSIITFSAFINLLMLAPSWYMLMVYDRVLTSRDENTLLGISIIVIYIYVLFALLERYRGLILVEISEKIDKIVAPKIHYLLSHSNEAFNHNMGLLNELNTVKQFMTGAPMLAMLDMPWSFLYLILIFFIHPSLGWLSIGSVLILFIIALLNQFLTHLSLNRAQKALYEERKFVVNVVNNVDSIKTMGMSQLTTKQMSIIRERFLEFHIKASIIGVSMTSLSKFFKTIIQSTALGFGAYLAINGNMSSGLIIAGTILLGRILSPIEGIIASWKQISEFKKSFLIIKQILLNTSQKEFSVSLGRPLGKIELKNVTLKLREHGKASLQDITLKIEPGQCLGLIGPSGAGKTSLLKIMCGIYKPSAGEVFIDNSDLNNSNVDELGQYIGYLSQISELMAGKISNNICRYTEVNSNDILQAAKLSGAHDAIISLPQSYDTELGDFGHGLSEGQKRKIALARAFYGKPAILFLDEPGNGLDEKSLQLVVNGIGYFKSIGTTVVFTSHDPKLIDLADQLGLIVDGRLVMHGPKEQVLSLIASK